MKNKEWDIPLQSKHKYSKMLDAITLQFAKFVAHLERDYIFAWLDWDGDNVLANAGIIDYGSIRQFGVRHDQYRYDDVDRFSTNLNEQKQKAAQIIQAFCQLVDFLETKEKKTLDSFKNHPSLVKFNEAYQYSLLHRFLFQLGYPVEVIEVLLLKNRASAKNLYEVFESLEKVKTKDRIKAVEDGINRPAIFNLRKLAQALPKHLNLLGETIRPLESGDIFDLMKVNDIHKKDDSITPAHDKNIQTLQELYALLFTKAHKISSKISEKELLDQIKKRSKLINSTQRITGNSLLYIVTELLEKKKKGMKPGEVQSIIENFINTQCLNPDLATKTRNKTLQTNKSKALMRTMITLLDEYCEDI